MKLFLIVAMLFSLTACCKCKSVRFPAGAAGEREAYLSFESQAWQKLDLPLQNAWGKAVYAKKAAPLKILLRLQARPSAAEFKRLSEAGLQRTSAAGKILSGDVFAPHLETLAKLPFVSSLSLQQVLSTKSNE